MALEKLEIQIEDTEHAESRTFVPYFTAQFNPKQLSFSTRSRWQPVPTKGQKPDKQYTGGDGASLSLELFFDTYEDGSSVKDWIDPLRVLTEIQPKVNRPPQCLLFWGGFGSSQGRIFAGILESLQETYTLFLPDGTPVRATVQCSFTELTDKQDEPAARNPKEETSSVVPDVSDTLSSLAAEKYGDPAAWRKIAAANNIDDPSELPAGIPLVVPPQAGGWT